MKWKSVAVSIMKVLLISSVAFFQIRDILLLIALQKLLYHLTEK